MKRSLRNNSTGSFSIKQMSYFILIIVFLVSVYFLSTEIESYVSNRMHTKVTNIGMNNSNELRTIKIKNEYGYDVLVYFEDGETGSFLANIGPDEVIKVSALSGHTLYATDINGWNRISDIHIIPNKDIYSFKPTEENEVLEDGTKEGSSYYKIAIRRENRPHPKVKALQGHEHAYGAMAAKFRSLSAHQVDLWYDDGHEGVYNGHLNEGQETTTNTYEGHVFFVTRTGNKNDEIARFEMDTEKVLYVIYDEKFPAAEKHIKHTEKEIEFINNYHDKTGIWWRHFYGNNGPRPPPILHMWPADNVGDVHMVKSTQGFWSCENSPECQSPEDVILELEVISQYPRAFIINNFLSDYEVNHIVEVAKTKLHKSAVGDSTTGVLESNTRTSLNAWVGRHTDKLTDSLFRRAAHLLNVDDELLDHNTNAEHLQVVHYSIGQKYDSHHDWGVSGHPESRYITLLLYLNDQESPTAGGETSFPKAFVNDKQEGIKVHPGKGSAVLFYNLLEDGNGDDLALHAALPVTKGEKWLANFWVWDPVMNIRE